MSMHQLLVSSLWLAQVGGSAPRGTSFLQFLTGGGIIGYIIIALSIAALAMVVVHLLQIRRKALIPSHQIEALDAALARGDINGALEYCMTPENDSYLTRIFGAGLTRYQNSAFGAFEIKTAIEEAGEEQTARLYRSTDALGVIGSIAPLLGLLGTVLGMVGAFDTVSKSAVQESTYYESLAGNISLALITTLQGLIVAIPCVALFTYFRNRIDAFAAEAGAEIERLAIHLESAPANLPPNVVRPAARPPAGGGGSAAVPAPAVGAAPPGAPR